MLTTTNEYIGYVFGTLNHDFGVFQLAAYHVCEPRPKPWAWAGLGFLGLEARAWIFSGPHQAEPSQAGPAHHYSQL